MQDYKVKPITQEDDKSIPLGNKTPVISGTQGRYIPTDKCREVLECAIALRSIETSRVSVSELEAIANGEQGKSNPFTMADTLGIEREYIEKALQKVYPSNEVQFNDLKDIPGAKFDTIGRVTAYSVSLKNALQREFPSDTFETKSDDYYRVRFFRVSKKAVKKRFFWKTYHRFEERKEEIAEILLNQSKQIQIRIDSPSFLRATSDELKRLSEFFGIKESSVSFTYDVDIADAMKNKV